MCPPPAGLGTPETTNWPPQTCSTPRRHPDDHAPIRGKEREAGAAGPASLFPLAKGTTTLSRPSPRRRDSRRHSGPGLRPSPAWLLHLCPGSYPPLRRWVAVVVNEPFRHPPCAIGGQKISLGGGNNRALQQELKGPGKVLTALQPRLLGPGRGCVSGSRQGSQCWPAPEGAAGPSPAIPS